MDPSTLLFDTDDEGTDDDNGKGEYDSEDEGKDEDEDEDRHIAKKARSRGKFKVQTKKEASPPPPDSSCLAYYPKTYSVVQKWNKLLGLPPPHPMNDALTTTMPKCEVDAPAAHVAKSFVPSGFRAVVSQAFVKKNAFYDETKAGFGRLPGEIRSRSFLDLLFYCISLHTPTRAVR